MKVLALDIATSVGWAAGDGSVEGTVYGTKRLQEWCHDYGAMSYFFGMWLCSRIDEHQPQMVAIEKSVTGRGGNVYHLAGLSWDAHRIAYIRDLDRIEYAPATIKKHVTGNGRAEKRDVIEAVSRLGFKPLTDHEADAIALLRLTASRANIAPWQQIGDVAERVLEKMQERK